MELQYYGANCIRIHTKKAQLVIDDNIEDLGLKPVAKKGDIVLFTSADNKKPKTDSKIVIDQPGEYEVSGVSLQGIAARSHMDEEDKKSTSMYKAVISDMTVAITGHIHPDLGDEQLEQLGRIDVLILPVGGNGYTLDSVGALKVIREIEPKLVIPTHYDDDGITYPVPQQNLEQVLKNLPMDPKETVGKLKLKSSDLADITQLIVLERQ